MWIDPHETGLYLGQCAQYCGTQHAKMLLRVYVDSREDFDTPLDFKRALEDSYFDVTDASGLEN